MLGVELRRFPKFQVRILKTDFGKNPRREGSARPIRLYIFISRKPLSADFSETRVYTQTHTHTPDTGIR